MSDQPRNPVLVGERLYLRPIEPSDMAQTRQWLFEHDFAAQTCRPLVLGSTEPSKAEASGAWNRGELMAIALDTGEAVGRVRYFDWNPRNRSAEIGYSIRPDMRQKGYGREGVGLLLDLLFGTQGLNKVYAQTAAFNTASVALLERLGFKRDGVLREHHCYEGRLHDDYVYSLLSREWRPEDRYLQKPGPAATRQGQKTSPCVSGGTTGGHPAAGEAERHQPESSSKVL